MVKHNVEYVVKSLVDAPELVQVSVSDRDGKEVYDVNVGPQDIGKVIGKDGQTIRALRMLINALTSSGKEIEITIAK